MRALVKMPLLEEESAEVKMTTFSTEAAAGIPILCQATTNGLALGSTFCQGINIKMTTIAPT
jgi:hypothetical protein